MGTVSTMPGSEGRRGQRQEMDARRRDLRRKGFTVVSGWGIRRREQAGTEFGFALSNKLLSIGVCGDTKDVH